MFKCKFCQIDGNFEADCRDKDNSSDKDKNAKDKDIKTSKSVFTLRAEPLLFVL
jgi:hypothetical protein